MRSLFALAALLAFTTAGCARTNPAPTIDAVFLIVVDTLRPDRLSCYGYADHETPAVDRLAASGTRFERAQAVASWTVPSMGSLLTSRYPRQLGLVERPDETERTYAWREKRTQVRYTLPKGVPTMAGLMDDAGFFPIAFVNQPFLNVSDGFLQGFAAWAYTVNEDSVAWHDVTVPLPNPDYAPGTDLGNADVPLAEAFDVWLSGNADLMPFAWVHLLKPHYPYTPHARFMPEHRQDPDARVPTDELYAGEVQEADATVGMILESIDRHVGLDRALVIFTSDHGEELRDHGMGEHGHSLHREVVQVPLIIAGPSIPRGRVIPGDVRLIDVLPTVLALLGRASSVPADAEGADLAPQIDARAGSLPVYAEGMLYGSTERSFTEDGYKLMYDVQTDPAFRLFDVETDPLERHDMAAAAPDRVARMQHALRERFESFTEDYAGLVHADTNTVDPETERILKAMRALGYVND